MILPDIKVLMEQMDSRYTLVVAVSKRARQIVDGNLKLTNFNSDKAVTLAIHEIAESRISYYRPNEVQAAVTKESFGFEDIKAYKDNTELDFTGGSDSMGIHGEDDGYESSPDTDDYEERDDGEDNMNGWDSETQ